jgi:predicted glycoside hydrolase/deacetylase ChbG (UPF0249 family)
MTNWIVNADDLGLRAEITDVTLRCWNHAAISSSTLMVHMADSTRAAELAIAAGLPCGLHLNLTYPFDDRQAPDPVRERQRAAVGAFARRISNWTYDPRLRGLVTDCVTDQLAEFRRLTGRSPTHIDGHHHVQTCPSVWLNPALREVHRMRPGHSRLPRRSPTVASTARSLRDRPLRRRFAAPDRFFDVRQLHELWGGPGLNAVTGSPTTTVEIMVHPSRPDEEDLLLGPLWQSAIADRPLVSYESLT